MSIPSVTPRQLEKILNGLDEKLDEGIYTPLHIVGSPGIGKTNITKNYFTNKLKYKIFITTHGSYFKLGDWGIPAAKVEIIKENGRRIEVPLSIVFLKPDFFPKSNKKTVWFIDEIDAAEPNDQKLFYELMLDRKIGDYEVPKNVIIICAGNKITDRANTFEMSTPLANRMAHVELVSSGKDFVKYAKEKELHPAVINYIDHDDSNLFAMEEGELAWPSPRSWEAVAVEMSFSSNPDVTMIAAHIGQAHATKFLEFTNSREFIPDVNEILKGKLEKSNFNNKQDVQFMTVRAIINKLPSTEKLQGKNKVTEINKLQNGINFVFTNCNEQSQQEFIKSLADIYGKDVANDLFEQDERFANLSNVLKEYDEADK